MEKFKVRLMKLEDFNDVLAIDEKVNKVLREEYYKLKFEKLVKSGDYVPTSLVCENEDGKVVGFIMGELFIGEYGISEDRAKLDTIGVDPEYQKKGVGKLLLKEFIDHLKSLGVEKISTLVAWNDIELIKFFSSNNFEPSKTIHLELKI